MRTAVSRFCSINIIYPVRGVGTRKVKGWDDYSSESGGQGRKVIIVNEKGMK